MIKAFVKQSATLVWVVLSLIFVFSGASVRAQGVDGAATAPQHNEDERRANTRRMGRRDPLRALNLTGDQLRQIRAIREESKDEWRVVRERLAQAHSALDEAIYADNVDEALVEERTRAMGAAQAALARMRAITELKIRRVLTPEQLNTLRTMRQQARAAEREQGVENGQGQRPSRRDRFGQRDGGPLPRDDFNGTGGQRVRRGDATQRGRQP
ncbi:MAG TPA: Spy/CpxP family protein refolding chaperone [Pyrinomonadaceae bacterium]|jgi:Spy/CpxP family protein refolding chaperone